MRENGEPRALGEVWGNEWDFAVRMTEVNVLANASLDYTGHSWVCKGGYLPGPRGDLALPDNAKALRRGVHPQGGT
jgi:hypothetical protein